MSENTIPYPSRPSDFLALLERTNQLQLWDVKGRGFGLHWYVEFSPRTPFSPPRSQERECLHYGGNLPVVKLGKVEFDLLRLFESGQPWDPHVYVNNPYMPVSAKAFLSALFEVLVPRKPQPAPAPALPEAA